MKILASAAAALLAAGLLWGAGAPAQAAKLATTDKDLEATIQIERRVRLPQGGAAARIHVNVAVRNTGKEALILKAPGQCAVHKYAIVHPNNDPILVKASKECPGEDEVQITLAAGETRSEGATMRVRGGTLEAGRRYYVIYEYWGVKVRSPFRILEDN